MKRIFLLLILSAASAFSQGGSWGGGGGGGSGTVTSVGASGDTGISVSGVPFTVAGTIALDLDTELSQISALADPNADRGLFWDDSAGAMAWLEFGSGLTLTGTTLTATSLGDGDKGDITVSSTGTVWTIDTTAVTFAKLQNISTATFVGRSTAGSGSPEELSAATAKALLNLTGTNSGDVTLSGSLDYLTLSGQVITLAAIDLATDVTGSLPAISVSFSDPESNYSASNVDAALAELDDIDGNGPNSSTGKVDWTQITGMPAGFADNTDDSGAGGSGSVKVDGATITNPDFTDTGGVNFTATGSTVTADVGANSVALTADTTGAYAAGDAEGGNALTGDSASAFFATGQLERARGGTGADTSAFGASLFGSSSSNTTIAVNTPAALETALAGTNVIINTEIDTVNELNALITDANLVPQSLTLEIAGTANEITSSTGAQDLTTGRIWTLSLASTIDLGGKSSLEIPNGSSPSVDAFGEIAGDSNLWGASRGALVFYDGTAAVAAVAALVSDTPTDGQVPVWHTDGTTTWETFTATPGGADTQVQFNNAGVLAGAAGMTWNSASSTLTVQSLSTTTLNATAHRILDNVDQSHALNIVANENLTSDVSLFFDLDGASRNVNITGNTTLSGINTGDQTITLTGEVTGTGTGSFATTIADTVSVTDWTLTTPTISGAISFPDNTRQTFNPGSTTAGLNVGANAGDPSTPSNGDLWYDSTGNLLRARINGASVSLGAGGGGGAPTDATYLVTTANGTLSAEEVVGTTPGGELGGTWAAPTLDDAITVTGWELGASTATTPAANDNDTSLATTAYVQGELTGYASDTATLSNKTLTAPRFADLGFIADASGAEMLIFNSNATAVNEITIANAPTGFNPAIAAGGDDASVGLDFYAKGFGKYRFTATTDQAAMLVLYEDASFGSDAIEIQAPSTNFNSAVVTLPETSGTLLVADANIGNATAATPTAGDDSTKVATTAFVQDEVDATQTASHASPATGTESPTWTGPMHSVWCGATMTVNLPAAASYTGRGILVYNTGAFVVTIEPNGSESIVRAGTIQTGGVNFTLSSGAGNYVALISDGTRWITLGYIGTLAVGT